VAIGPDVAFLDIGGKSEATIDIAELRDEEGDIEVEVGETIEALVVGTDGGLKLSRKLARGAAAKEHLGEAFRAGLPVEGRSRRRSRAATRSASRACAPSVRSRRWIFRRPPTRTSTSARSSTFRIIEYKEGGKNVILSRRRSFRRRRRPAPRRRASRSSPTRS
jgi:small subunit ribosomal protein S1